jgi:hypothetical protein
MIELLYYNNNDKLVKRLAGETGIFGENLLQFRFVHQRSHMTLPGLELGRQNGKSATNRLSYGTALSPPPPPLPLLLPLIILLIIIILIIVLLLLLINFFRIYLPSQLQLKNNTMQMLEITLQTRRSMKKTATWPAVIIATTVIISIKWNNHNNSNNNNNRHDCIHKHSAT